MRNRLIGLLLVSSFILAGCASVSSTTRISSNISAKEFNSIASKYMDRPTFVSIEFMSDSAEVLTVQMNGYKKPQHTSCWTVRFDKKYAAQYIAFITKYLDWESIAVKRGDTLSKEIGQAKTWSSGVDGYIKFGFYSGNELSHYLTLDFCAAGTCIPTNIMFDRRNAENLRELLTDFLVGDMPVKADMSVYN